MVKAVLILDAGSQYIKLIDKIIRNLGYKTDIMALNVDISLVNANDFGAIIISGGPSSVYEPNAIKCDPELFNLGIPILGICYGMQLINYLTGGIVCKKLVREDGVHDINIIKDESLLFHNMDKKQQVLLTHGDSLETISDNYKITSTSSNSTTNMIIVTSIENTQKKIYGVQFHPEVDITPNGQQMFYNFFTHIAGLEASYTIDNRLNEITENIKMIVGDKKVIMLVSGGVDSSVCLALLHKVIPKDQIIAVHIDHGFLRKTEHHIIDTLNKLYGVTILDAKNDFYNGTTHIDGQLVGPLKTIIEPEQKRKIIGNMFINVIDSYFDRLGIDKNQALLVQGTLRPDLIESSSSMATVGKAATIKTHHNDTQLVRDMRAKGLILEPLKDFHKSEVRSLGKQLGLTDEIVNRHPFCKFNFFLTLLQENQIIWIRKRILQLLC
jgi:GMP synthase (glutamine-hydrolysing)